MALVYPAAVEQDAEDGRYVVRFPDFGWGATDGSTLGEALAEATGCLDVLIEETMRAGEALPEPSEHGDAMIQASPEVAAAAVRYAATREHVS